MVALIEVTITSLMKSPLIEVIVTSPINEQMVGANLTLIIRQNVFNKKYSRFFSLLTVFGHPFYSFMKNVCCIQFRSKCCLRSLLSCWLQSTIYSEILSASLNTQQWALQVNTVLCRHLQSALLPTRIDYILWNCQKNPFNYGPLCSLELLSLILPLWKEIHFVFCKGKIQHR